MPVLTNNCGDRYYPDRDLPAGSRILVIWDDGIENRFATEIYTAQRLYPQRGRPMPPAAEALVRQAAMTEVLLGTLSQDECIDMLNAEGGAPWLIAAIECEGGALLLGEIFGLFAKEEAA